MLSTVTGNRKDKSEETDPAEDKWTLVLLVQRPTQVPLHCLTHPHPSSPTVEDFFNNIKSHLCFPSSSSCFYSFPSESPAFTEVTFSVDNSHVSNSLYFFYGKVEEEE